MSLEILTYSILVGIAAFYSRVPFLDFPIDEDMATYTYRARFSEKGLEWKQDMFSFYPIWRMRVLDAVYGSRPEIGIYRIRVFIMICHILACLGIFATVLVFSGNAQAALISGILYSFLGVAPAFSAESFNFEQVFLPFVIWGTLCFGLGFKWYLVSGLLFGLAAIAKCSVSVFAVFLSALFFNRAGFGETVPFMVFAFLPLFLSHFIEWKMGYLDVEGKKQFRLRMIATLRCSKLKQIYGSVLRDIKTIAKQTLPLWFVGWPSIVICINRPHGILISVVVATAVFMIVCQKGFSRYHYIPLTAFLAISTGLGITQFWEQGGIVGVTATTILFISSSWAGYKISPYFFKAQEISVLSRYEKFEQFIYLPLLGKSLRRLIRRKHEQNQRLFVWGNFVQLYHETGLPASDAFVHYCIGPWDNPALADYFDTVIGGLIRHKPVYFIKTYPNINMELLESITGLKYKLIKIAYSRYPVYKLENHNLKIQNPLALSQKEKLSLMEELTKNVSLVPIVDKSDIKCGRFLEGIKECRRALRANPYDAEIVKYLAELYDRSGQAHKVVDTLSTLIRLRPETNHVRLILASIALKKNRLDDGSLLIDQEVTCFGENSEIIFHRGLLAKAKGEIEFSAVLFEKFLESKPFRMDVWLELAQALEKCDKIGVAKDAYLDLWDRANKTDDSDWIRTQCALALSRLDECLRNKSSTLQYFFQKDASNEQLAYAYASALEIEGNSNQARSLFDNFTQTFRQTYILAAVWFRLARLSESEKKEEMLRKCIELNPLHSGAARELQSLEASFAEA